MISPFGVPADITYVRFYRGKQVLRVARIAEAIGLALYPTKDQNTFEVDVFKTADDSSPRGKLARTEIKDGVWLRLLDGEPISEILKRFQESGYYHIHRSARSRYDPFKSLDLPTFRIAQDSQERSSS